MSADRELLAAALRERLPRGTYNPAFETDADDIAHALLAAVDRIATERAAAALRAAADHCDLMFRRGEDEWRGKPDSHAKSTALGRNIAHRRDAIYLRARADALDPS